MYAKNGEIAQAGGWAQSEFRRRRSQRLREGWRDCVRLIGIGVISLTTALLTTGPVQLIAVAVFGFFVAIALVVWNVGDVRALPYAWGAIGEQQTAWVLAQLGPDWYSVHDVPAARGNWDHICVGPAGIFMIETKKTSRPVSVSDDMLRCGGMTYGGRRIRAVSFELRQEIRRRGGWCPYVHAVVAIWGDFAQRSHEEQGVTYIAGDELPDWMRSRPPKLSDAQVTILREAIRGIAADRRGLRRRTG